MSCSRMTSEGRTAFFTVEGGGGGCTRCVHGRSRMAVDPRIPTIYAGTEHVAFPPTRQTLLAPRAKRREVFGESHQG